MAFFHVESILKISLFVDSVFSFTKCCTVSFSAALIQPVEYFIYLHLYGLLLSVNYGDFFFSVNYSLPSVV